MSGTDSNQTGENVDLSRRARSVSDDGAVYVVPGNGTTCLFLQTGTGRNAIARGGCDTVGHALDGHLYRVASGPDLGLDHGEALVYGIAPDGVDTVSITGPDGKTTKAPVVNSVWLATVPESGSTTVTVGSTELRVQGPPA